MWKLLRRRGWSCQVPVRRAVERDGEAVEVWKERVWPRVKTMAADLGCPRLFRGRGRAGPETAEGAHVGTARGAACGAGAGPGYRPGQCGRPRSASGPAAARTCSAGCTCTTGTRANPGASPGRATAI
ncbi:winged helix-turn-helix domain-containing protein [Streptomyces sp. NPDC001817]|uniref:helix-turn-helix domain-containing protein n=1 Tax=Streptomyces sp. NPDC001817 TaxID=3154398 RepID=UPI003328D278